jgi:hypothetical protein
LGDGNRRIQSSRPQRQSELHETVSKKKKKSRLDTDGSGLQSQLHGRLKSGELWFEASQGKQLLRPPPPPPSSPK